MMFFAGAMLARLIVSGGFGWFVQQHMKWPLILASAALIIFGLVEVVAAWREESEAPETTSRSRGPLVGWLLALPLLVLVAVSPTALGAAAADRVDAYTPTEAENPFEPIEESSEPVEMRVLDFLDRAMWDEERSLEGVTVRLEGLVVNDPDHTDGFTLTRFLVSCCAADGIPLQVDLHDVGQTFENDTWVIADVVWIEPDVPYTDLPAGERRIAAEVVNLTEVPDARKDPYESPY
jgi:uncharacterized repeat protein (TIGR03943 family)